MIKYASKQSLAKFLLSRLFRKYKIRVNENAAARVLRAETAPYNRIAEAMRKVRIGTNQVRFGHKYKKPQDFVERWSKFRSDALKDLANAKSSLSEANSLANVKRLYRPTGAPKITLKDRVKPVAAIAAATTAATAALPAGVAISNAIESTPEERTDSNPVTETDDKHSVVGYGAGGALAAAATAYALSERKNRLRNMLIAGTLGGAGGAGLAYLLNKDEA